MIDSWNAAKLNELITQVESKIQANDVIANPTGAATADLSKVSIDGTVYATKPNIDFSTTEQDTGLKWVDGRVIYQKTIDLEGLYGTDGVKNVAHGITDLDIVINSFGYGKSSTEVLPIPAYINANNASYTVGVYYNSTNIVIRAGSSISNFTEGYITLLYVKTEV